MSKIRARRWPWIAAGLAVALLGLAAFGLHAALRAIEREVAHALGPGAAVGAVRVTPTAVELTGLSIPPGRDWPAPESLRAERVRIVPTWRSLLSRPIEIAHIEITAPYLAMVRTRDGRLRVLPTLVEEAEPPASGANPTGAASVAIGAIHFDGGVLEVYDATVARPPWKLRLTEVDARIGDIVAPALDGRMPFELEGVVDGPQRDGRIALDGWLVPATRDLELRADAAGVDLLALEPYLVEAAKARLTSGTLDLGIHATVAERHLRAPGHLTLSNLSFAHGGSASRARVLGMPRDLVLAALQAKGGRISLDFSLDGRIDDPKFSLNETLSTRVGVALAKELGVSIGGLVEGTLGIGHEGLEGAGKAATGVGSALRRLLPGE